MNFRISKYVTIYQEKLLKKYSFNWCKKQTKYKKIFEPVLFLFLRYISESVFCIYSIFLPFNYSFIWILWPSTKSVSPPKKVNSVWIVSFINSSFKSSHLSLLPFLVARPCRSIWALFWLLSLGLLSFWSSLSTRWMMHSRDLSTFTQTFSWRDMGIRLCCHGNHIKLTTTSGDVCDNAPTPLHASPCAARNDCCDRSTWPAACPDRCGGLLVPSRWRETFWRRCTRAVLRAAPEWLRPATYSHTPWQADGSAGWREELQPLTMNMLYIQKQPSQTNESHLIGQDGERSLQPTGGSVLGSSGKTLGVVADLSLECVDVGDDLFGTNDVLGYVDDGLWAGEGAAAETGH